MFFKKLKNYNVLLASRSKRRHELLNELGIKFKIIDQNIDESYPKSLKKKEITEHLAIKKSSNLQLLSVMIQSVALMLTVGQCTHA